MTSDPFVSYAQNAEDVLLWRALGHVPGGRYVDIGAADPEDLSVTKAFYDRGWRGVNVDPVPQHAEALRKARPDDEVIEAAITAADVANLTLHEIRYQADDAITGLSTTVDGIASTHGESGYVVADLTVPAMPLSRVFESDLLGGDVHFLKVDVEGSEEDVLRSMDFTKHRPWVVLVEATEPLSTEPSHEGWEPILLEADYEFMLFDGLSRYYVAAEHPELKEALSYPVCVFDEFHKIGDVRLNEALQAATAAHAAAAEEAARLWADVVQWRNVAFDSWASAVVEQQRLTAQMEEKDQEWQKRFLARRARMKELRARVEQMESSASWRVTRPLRGARSKIGRRGKATKQ